MEKLTDASIKTFLKFFIYLFFRILNIFNTHMGRGEKVLKKLIVVLKFFINKCDTFQYMSSL